MPIITISHQIGSGGREIGQAVARKLEIPYLDQQIIQEVAKKLGISEEEAGRMDEKADGLLEVLLTDLGHSIYIILPHSPSEPPIEWLDKNTFQEASRCQIEVMARRGNAVIPGHGANFILANRWNVLSVFIYAPEKQRIETLARREGLSLDKAAQLVHRNDHQRKSFIRTFYNANWQDPSNYHLMINTATISPEQATELITCSAQRNCLPPLKLNGVGGGRRILEMSLK